MQSDDLLVLLPEFSNYCQLERNADALTVQKHIYHLKVILRTYGRFDETVGKTHLLALRKTHKPASIKRWLYAMRILCDFMQSKGLLGENWARKIPEPKVPRTVVSCPTTEEVEQIVGASFKRTFIHYKDKEAARYLWDTLYLFLAHTGCRLGEMLGIKQSDMFWENGTLFITLNETKTDIGRVVPLNKTITERVSRYLKPDCPKQYLFIHPLTNGPLRHHQVERQFQLRMRFCKIYKDYTVHSLRKYFITNLLTADVSVRKVMELVGHVNMSTTQRYASMERKELVLAVERHPLQVKNETEEETLRDLEKYLRGRGIINNPRFAITQSPGFIAVKSLKTVIN